MAEVGDVVRERVGQVRTRAAGLLVLLVLTIGCHGANVEGPLQPPSSRAPAANVSGFREALGHAWTFGMLFPIRNYGRATAVLDDAVLVDSTGGVDIVGMLAADITGQHHTWSGDDVFPPRHPSGQLPLQGFEIRPFAAQAVQVLLGLRLTREGLHGFRAVAILYHVGGRHYRYVFPSGAYACTPATFRELRGVCLPEQAPSATP